LWEETLRLLVVAVLASAVGIERELRDQEAGLRTHMLVGVGAALFVIAGNFSWSDIGFGNSVGVVLDPSRVVAYVITGVGFLGAGAIIKNGTNIRGLTTAASLWAVAAIGVTIGAGGYALGVAATLTVLLSLWPVRELVRVLGLRAAKTHRLDLELGAGADLASVIRAVEGDGSRIASARMKEESDVRRLEIVVIERTTELAHLVERASSLPGVKAATLVT
jgi:putative Mg2+ transporter-C (MgtC) family protein